MNGVFPGTGPHGASEPAGAEEYSAFAAITDLDRRGRPSVLGGGIFYAGVSNLALAPDGKRFAVLPMPEAAGTEKGTVHVTFLLNFLDELRRRIPK